MIDDDATPDASPPAFAYFYTPQIGTLAETVGEIASFAAGRGWIPLTRQALALITEILEGVNRISAEMAVEADAAVIREIHLTHTAGRPLTDEMETHIFSKPGALGEVRVGLLEELDKITNYHNEGYGPFWRAQEYGTGTHGIESQVGRVLMGSFFDSGTPPDADKGGLNAGDDQYYLPRYMHNAPSGWGTISVDLPGRHFLQRGSEAAGTAYIAAIDAVQTGWQNKLDEMATRLLTAGARAMGGASTFILKA